MARAGFKPPPEQRDVWDEQIRMFRLRLRTDLTTYRLGQTSMTREHALLLIEQTREEILALCPGKDAVFDLVLRPRFMRLLNERAICEWRLADSMN